MNALQAKRLFALLLALTMVFGTIGAQAFAMEIPAITAEPSDTDRQLSLIQTKASGLLQPDDEMTWYYTVSDLDHDGNLELVAAAQHPRDRSTNLRVWEVNAERSALTECTLEKDPEESFPDILTDVADTFHNEASDTWYYMVYDNIVNSDTEVYTIKTSVTLKDGKISYQAYAVEHTQVTNGLRSVTHTDDKGVAISQEQYNASGIDAMTGNVRSSTSFEWLKAAETGDLTRLTDSFAVFMGQKAPSGKFDIPTPAALTTPPAATPAPAETPAPQPELYLTITKNPTNENRTEGETAYFVAYANAFESLKWTFVSPDGGEYSAQTIQNMWGVLGGYLGTTLSVSNVSTGMSNWGVYCTFYYKGQTARTATAFMNVTPKSRPAPSGTYSGTVTDYSYSTVTINVENQVTVTLERSACDISGELYVGASAQVLWDGRNIVACYINGDQPAPPQKQSMNGNAYEGGGGYAISLSNGQQVYVDGWKCYVSGSFYEGAPCVVYYAGNPSTDNIFQVNIYGGEEAPTVIGVKTCPNCGENVAVHIMVCPNCGYDFDGGSSEEYPSEMDVPEVIEEPPQVIEISENG